MKPEQSLNWSIATVFGAIGLTMLLAAGPEPVVIWFLVCLPMWWSLIMLMVSLWWDKQEQGWRDQEWEWKREKREWEWDRKKAAGWESVNDRSAAQWKSAAEYWKARAIRAEGAASLWRVTAGGGSFGVPAACPPWRRPAAAGGRSFHSCIRTGT